VSILASEALLDKATRLLDGFNWEGVAMVECKIDAATGVPYLIEINGRFWGTTQLAVDAGVDFPALLVRRVLGEAALGPERYRVGYRERWWWGEVDYLLARLRRSGRDLALPPDAPGRAQAIRDVVRDTLLCTKDAVFRLADPMPFLLESLQWFHLR